MSFLYQKTLETLKQTQDQIQTLENRLKEVQNSSEKGATSSEKMQKAATEKHSIYTHDTHLEPILSQILDTLNYSFEPLINNVFMHGSTPEDGVFTRDTYVEPILSNLYTSMDTAVATQQASTEPAKTEVISPELNELTESSEKQSGLQENMVTLLTQLVNLLQPELKSYEIQETLKSKTAELKNPNYHRTTSGRQIQVPSINLNSTGFM